MFFSSINFIISIANFNATRHQIQLLILNVLKIKKNSTVENIVLTEGRQTMTLKMELKMMRQVFLSGDSNQSMKFIYIAKWNKIIVTL